MTLYIYKLSIETANQAVLYFNQPKPMHRIVLVLGNYRILLSYFHRDPIAIESNLMRYTYIPVGEYAKHTKAKLFKPKCTKPETRHAERSRGISQLAAKS